MTTSHTRSEQIAEVLTSVLNKHANYGSKKYFSGELNLAGYNYAKDIINAVEYTSNIIVESNLTTIESIVELLKEKKDGFEEQFADREGFGTGTIAGIIFDIEDAYTEIR